MSTSNPYAKLHNDYKRERFTPFIIFSYPAFVFLDEVKRTLAAMCSDGISTPELQVQPVAGSWHGEIEPGVLVFVQGLTATDAQRISEGIILTAIEVYGQESVVVVADNRQATLCTALSVVQSHNKTETTVDFTYMGRWEAYGKEQPVDEDWTMANGTYYTIRKYKGEN